MRFYEFDLNNWPRAETFRHFTKEVPCSYSMTASLDVTNLLFQTRKAKISFFAALLYGISRIVNIHPEFRMATNDAGNPGYFERCNPSYTVFHQNGEYFSNAWTEFSEDLPRFLTSCREDVENCLSSGRSKPDAGENIFFVSCIPWTSFSGFHLNIAESACSFQPIFTIGKYTDDGERVLLPLAVQVHHAACDGFHVSRFVNELQEWANGFVFGV